MLRRISSYAAKLIWKCLSEHEQTTPAMLQAEIGGEKNAEARRTVFRSLNELVAGGFAVRVEMGLYLMFLHRAGSR